jgi:hypothetical protein
MHHPLAELVNPDNALSATEAALSQALESYETGSSKTTSDLSRYW